METLIVTRKLQANAKVFRAMFCHIEKEEMTWRPGEGKWNLLEIVCHLYDEEREDFRAMIKHLFQNPGAPLPFTDPEAWVHSRDYGSKDFDQTVKEFLLERQHSVEWLEKLENPRWEKVHQHPEYGPLSAGMFLHNWLAHDYLHIRQVNRLKYLYLIEKAGVDLRYAGRW